MTGPSSRAALPPGWRVGHATDAARRTGCTVILPPAGTIAAVDVRGGAPGTRETGVFTPGNLVSEIHGLLFTGGSAFGLAAATGVMAYLERAGVGYAIGAARVPIVAAAVLFDLAVGDPRAFPDAAMGERACEASSEGDVEQGAVGAGTGATAGKLLGVARASRGGVGVASIELPGAGLVAALAAVNCFGDVVNPDSGEILAGPMPADGAAANTRPVRTMPALIGEAPAGPASPPSAPAAGNTTLVCVAATIPFDQASLKRVAIEAHDGIARAVRPAHTVVDGDVAFALAPGGSAPPVAMRLRVGAAAAECVARAIVSAALAGRRSSRS